MKRREFARLAVLGACTSVFRSLISSANRAFAASPNELSFFVAGVRFCKISRRPVAQEAITLMPTTFRGHPAYEVVSQHGEQLGFVPKALLPKFDEFSTREGRLSFADHFAVPWKRYQVTVRLDGSATRGRGKDPSNC